MDDPVTVILLAVAGIFLVAAMVCFGIAIYYSTKALKQLKRAQGR